MSSTRLALALTTSGLLLGLTWRGDWAFLPSALLFPAPLILAVRCLPLRVGVPLAFLVGAVAHFVTARHSVTVDVHAVAALAAAALWLVPMLLDRVCATWLPRAGFLAFPFAAVVLARAAGALAPESVAAAFVHPAQTPALELWAADLSRTAVEGFLWMLASVTAGLASVHNWVVPDPVPQVEREDGLKVGGVAALVGFLLVFVGGTLRLRNGATAGDAAWHSDVLVVLAGAGLVALVAGAVVYRSRRKR